MHKHWHTDAQGHMLPVDADVGHACRYVYERCYESGGQLFRTTYKSAIAALYVMDIFTFAGGWALIYRQPELRVSVL